MLTDAVERWLTLLTLVSASLAALLYLVRKVWSGFKLVERLAELVNHELTSNGGTTMKDDLTAVARSVGQLQADVRELTQSKELAHELLQTQLDTLHHELDAPRHQPRHRGRGESGDDTR